MSNTPIPPKPKDALTIGGRMIKPITKPEKRPFARAYIKFSQLLQKQMKRKNSNVDTLVKEVDDEIEEKIKDISKEKETVEKQLEDIRSELVSMRSKVVNLKKKRADLLKDIDEFNNHKKLKGLVSAGLSLTPCVPPHEGFICPPSLPPQAETETTATWQDDDDTEE